MPATSRSRVSLEQVFKPKDIDVFGVPLCILDFRVALHSILGQVQQFCQMAGLELPLVLDEPSGKCYPDLDLAVDHELWSDWVRASWAIRLNRGPDMLPRAKYRVIVVDDDKLDGKYWRSLVYSGYKQSRTSETSRDKCYKSVRDIGHELVAELRLPFYSWPLYEADDWAGLVHRLKRSADRTSLLWLRELYYSTVDSDWLQLVDDESSQLWANTGPWPSRLKNEAETRAYVLKRMGLRIDKPCEIASVKQRQGDDADDLPAGSDLALFDLVQANPVYDLALVAKSLAEQLLCDLSHPEANTVHNNLLKAVRWCNSKGLPIVARP